MNLSAHLRFRKVIFLSLIVLIASVTIPQTSASHINSLSLEITDAFYCDEDLDGKENDILVYTKFKIQSPTNSDRIDYTITLTTPSGQSDTYTVTIYTTSTITLSNNFWNHATESGWYTVTVSAELNQDGEVITRSLVFDPPGGDNSDPKLFTVTKI